MNIYAIQFNDKSFLYSDLKNIVPALYPSKKEAQSDLDWTDADLNGKIVLVKVILI